MTFHGEYAPILLIASGRPGAALDQLVLAEQEADFDDDFSAALAKRLREFVASGAAIPADGEGIFAYRAPMGFDPAVRHDARHGAFMAVMRREVDATAGTARWRYAGGGAMKAVGAVARLRRRGGTPDVLEERWRTVAYDAAFEQTLDRAFARARRLVAYEAEIGVEVRAPVAGAAAVVVDGEEIGAFLADDLPEDVFEMPEGRTVARLTRKPRAPRYLVELWLLTDIGL